MNFIKKIIDKKIDNFVHSQFQKFGKGEFKNRARIRVKHSGRKYTIYTTAEFANEMVFAIAQKLGEEKSKVTGAIVSTSNLKGKLNFKNIKQFQGVKRYLLDAEMSGKEILGLLEKFPKSFFALSFEASGTKLKIKPKAPKSGKAESKGKKAPKPDFCKLITEDKKIGESFVFETADFKLAEINHTFFIEEMVISDELKKTNDFFKIREEALRKGKIVRKAVIDGKESTQEIEFEA